MKPTSDSAHQPLDARRLDLLVDAVTDYAIYMLDEAGFITSWNAGAERIKGYTAGEILGQHFARFFTIEDQRHGLPERILAQARAAGRHETEGWRVRKDGSRFWANAILQRVQDERGVPIGFAKITRDMSERLESQVALADSERRFRRLVESVVDYAIYMLDPSGIVTSWNPGGERLKGYTADEIVGQHFSRFYTKEDRAAGVPARALDIAALEERHESEGWRVRKDGSRFWALVVIDAIRDSSGRLEGFAKVTRDISERRAAQEALRESEGQLRRLVESVSDYALFMLDPNGIVTSWNSGARRIKGYTAEEVIGLHFSRFYTEQDRAAGLPARALHTAMTEGRYEAEGWRVRKDGGMFWANAVLDPIRDEAGQLIGFAKITRDITERRNAEISLQAAQAQRAHSQKMDALGQLTGGVAHDFNNLLMIVSGNIHTLKKRIGTDDARVTRAIEAIEQASRRGEALTRQLLTFSRRQNFDPTVLRIDERIEGFRAMMTSLIGAAIRLMDRIDAMTWPVKVDANELELALVNILLNARDAMPGGGSIVITTENCVLAPGDTPAGLAGEFVALRIVDTGCGIAPDVLPKVFDPFFSTKQVNKGTGLGLSQVHGFAHQSGGTVTITSELGKGTTVTMYFPRCREAAAGSAEQPAAERACGGRVLVVEDNPDVAEVTISMLRELGYAVASASDAAMALQMLDAQNFDLVVSDIVMPGVMDGVALAREARRRRPDLPILLVTGYAQTLGKQDGEFPILRKPFDLPELSRVTARMIAEATQPPTTNLVRLRDIRREAATDSDHGGS
jgi:PAS domain S-box-containing protein